MVSTELRLGNMVCDPQGSFCKVHSIEVATSPARAYIRLKDADGDKESFYIEQLQPIELSPDILEAAGFEQRKMPFTGNDGYAITNANWFIGLYYSDGVYKLHSPHFNLEIKYLHNLQNVVYDLSGGSELTIQALKEKK